MRNGYVVGVMAVAFMLVCTACSSTTEPNDHVLDGMWVGELTLPFVNGEGSREAWRLYLSGRGAAVDGMAEGRDGTWVIGGSFNDDEGTAELQWANITATLTLFDNTLHGSALEFVFVGDDELMRMWDASFERDDEQ